MRLKTDCDVITHSIVKQTWHITTKMEAAGNIQHLGSFQLTLPIKTWKNHLRGLEAKHASTLLMTSTRFNAKLSEFAFLCISLNSLFCAFPLRFLV